MLYSLFSGSMVGGLLVPNLGAGFLHYCYLLLFLLCVEVKIMQSNLIHDNDSIGYMYSLRQVKK